MAVQTYNKQLFYPGIGNNSGPLDASSRVQNYTDLNDLTKVVPYKRGCGVCPHVVLDRMTGFAG